MSNMNTVPLGATHKADFYGVTHYYRRVQYERMNHVSEEFITVVKWYWLDNEEWKDQSGTGFCPRRCEAI